MLTGVRTRPLLLSMARGETVKQGDYSQWPFVVCGLDGDARKQGMVTESLFCPMALFSVLTKRPPRGVCRLPSNWSAGRQQLLFGVGCCAVAFWQLLGRM